MKKIFQFFVLLMLVTSCSKESNDVTEPDNNFDRKALLSNWAENIIVPSFVDYQSKTAALVTEINMFNNNPTTENLEMVRRSWIAAYKSYQHVSMFSFGKADEIYFKEATNTYPTDTAGIESNVAFGTHDLSKPSQFSKQGLPALDYLLNGLATTDASQLEYYSTNINAMNYRKYLADVANKLQSNADLILLDWNSGFKEKFIAGTDSSVSGFVNIMTNNFVKNLEKDIRTGKLGIPSGVFSGGILYPNKVESYYKNDISKTLLSESLKAARDFFNGKHFNSNTVGESLKSYLDFVNANRDNQKLSSVIDNQFATTLSVNNNLNDSFSMQISSDNSKMIASYDALQRNVIYTKLDMMQALNISIDYVDSDGD